MSKYGFDKLFTCEEANELLPRLGLLVRELQVQANSMRERVAVLSRERPQEQLADMELDDIVELHPELRRYTRRMAELASQIEELGCFLKDIDLGLVDFPCERENEVVFLCWQYGETHITAWHAIEGGFASRRPLAGAHKQYLN